MREKIETKKYKKNEIVFREGKWEMCMYGIKSGSVGIYADYEGPNKKLLSKLDQEEFFGEMGLVEAKVRSATAVALENDTVLEYITPENFGEYFKERPTKVLMIMEGMSKRIRNLTEEYMDACKTILMIDEADNLGEEKSEQLRDRMKYYAAQSKSKMF